MARLGELIAGRAPTRVGHGPIAWPVAGVRCRAVRHHPELTLGDGLLTAFPALQASACAGETVLRGPLPDQAALHGVLGEIEALGLELVAVNGLA